MAFTLSTLVKIAQGGPVPGQTAPGNRASVYTYHTNDTGAAIETDGYFDGILENGLLKGDIIIAVLDLDGTVGINVYVVTVGGADVTVVHQDVA